ncbi:MAG: ketol-acid reductoisomerase [Gammaproteobacteria bacterium]|nr:ketol-acid reductoisomerase [Gammaproteobacteria bacterium]
MSAAIYEDKDIDLTPIDGRRIAVLGFGAQGRAHALNLRDSGQDVVVGLREGSASADACREYGLELVSLEKAAESELVVMLVPDSEQVAVYENILASRMKKHSALIFAHGYNIHYRRIVPREDLDVLLVAPLGIGEQVRLQYEAGLGVPALVGVHQDASGQARALAFAYAKVNGHGRAAVMETTFAEETETDLFAEQAVLCGGIDHLITGAYEILTEAGYSPEIAYFCCLHEVKLMADMIHRRGIAGTRQSISMAAEYGDYTRGPRIINEASRAAMRDFLAEIRDGRFADELDAEIEAGSPLIRQRRAAAESHDIEKVGALLRARMPWLRKKE